MRRAYEDDCDRGAENQCYGHPDVYLLVAHASIPEYVCTRENSLMQYNIFCIQYNKTAYQRPRSSRGITAMNATSTATTGTHHPTSTNEAPELSRCST